MKNFKEKQVKELSSIIGGETEGFTFSKTETPLPDGTVKVEYDITWVSKKF